MEKPKMLVGTRMGVIADAKEKLERAREEAFEILSNPPSLVVLAQAANMYNEALAEAIDTLNEDITIYLPDEDRGK